MIEFTCPSCGKLHRAKEAAAGKSGKCSCGSRITIPKPRPAEDGLALQPADDELAIQDDEDEPAVCEAGADNAGGGAPTPAGAVMPKGFVRPGPVAAQSEYRAATYVLIGVASIAGIALLVYAWIGYQAYKTYQRNREAIETHNQVLDDLKANREAEAHKKLLRCIELKPEWTACYLNAGVLAVKLEDGTAERLLTDFLDREPDKPYQAYAQANLGYLALRGEKPNPVRARTHLTKAAELAPDLPAPLVMLAALSYNDRDLEQANTYLDQAKSKLADLPPAGEAMYWRLRTYLAYEAGDKGRFVSSQRLAASRAQPAEFAAHAATMAYNLLLKQQTIDAGDDAEFLKLAEAAAANAPEGERPAMQQALGTVFYNLGDEVRALSYWEPLIDEKTPASDWLQTVADAVARRGQQAEKAEDKQGLNAKALALYRRLLADEAYRRQQGEPLFVKVLGFGDTLGDATVASELLKQGLAWYPQSAPLQRRAGFLALGAQDYAKVLEHLERALRLDPTQDDLEAELKRYKAQPTFDQFRPDQPKQYVPRPLIHVRIVSGTPLGIDPASVTMTLDGQAVKPALGGNECFYVPEGDLAGGEHVVEVAVKDRLGNAANGRFAFPVDMSPPDARLLKPDEGSTRALQPLIALSLVDEHGAVDPASVTVTLRNDKDNPSYCSQTIISKGVWRVDSPKLEVAKGDRLQDPEKIAFSPTVELKPGHYNIEIKMQDILGHAAEKALALRVY